MGDAGLLSGVLLDVAPIAASGPQPRVPVVLRGDDEGLLRSLAMPEPEEHVRACASFAAAIAPALAAQPA